MSSKTNLPHGDDCDCDKPEVKKSFKGKCSEEQIIKCHGKETLEQLKKEGRI
ncbi:MAG: hypothetical protein ACFFD4_06725 [Candidatus Odinarchaeota archaeon]